MLLILQNQLIGRLTNSQQESIITEEYNIVGAVKSDCPGERMSVSTPWEQSVAGHLGVDGMCLVYQDDESSSKQLSIAIRFDREVTKLIEVLNE